MNSSAMRALIARASELSALQLVSPRGSRAYRSSLITAFTAVFITVFTTVFIVGVLLSFVMYSSAWAQQASTAENTAENTAEDTAETEGHAAESDGTAERIRRCLAGATATAAAQPTPTRAPLEGQRIPERAVSDSLSQLESDLLSMGLFPNSQGYLDARLHMRYRYLRYLSTGLYFDYTTFRYEEGEGLQNQSEELVREYRLDLDLLKGVIPLHRLLGWERAQLSFEPGLNLKGIFQSIDGTSVFTNSFGEQIFRGEESEFQRIVVSAKAEMTLVLGRSLTVDLSGEYLPLIFSEENSEVLTSQFNGTVSPQRLISVTSGLQSTAALRYRTGRLGHFTLQGKLFLDAGLRSASSLIIDGNYSYESVDTAESYQRDIWLELIHSMTYLQPSLGFAPAFALGVQQRAVVIEQNRFEETTYRLGLLVEFDS